MSQNTSGWRALLSRPAIYRLCQDLLGGTRFHRELLKTHIRPAPGLRVLDLGCGPAAILEYLPEEVRYVGVDFSQEYITAARARYGARGEFHCLSFSSLAAAGLTGFDLVLGLGVLHHLDDRQAADFFRVAAGVLHSQGRCLTVDPCLVRPQAVIARLLIHLDRGCHPRTPDQYTALAATAFARIGHTLRHDGLRLPYTHHIMECGQ